ncbi:MAG: MFS transporter [Thermomicrobiales bacterium]
MIHVGTLHDRAASALCALFLRSSTTAQGTMTAASTAPAPSARPPGYRDLLSLPGARDFFIAGCIGRIPLAMRAMGCVLLVQLVTGSYGLAGLVGAVQTLVGAFAAPSIGRVADRYGERTILLWGTLIHAIGIVALVASVHLGANPLLMVPSAAIVGGSNIPFSSLSRARWTRKLGSRGPALERAYSLESMADEMGFVIGPLLVVPLCVVVDPAAGVLAALGFTIIAAAMLLRLPDTRKAAASAEVRLAPRQSVETPRSPIAIVGIRVVVGVLLAVGFLFGSVDIMIVSFAEDHGSKSAVSILAALFAFGSFLGAAAYGMIHWKAPIDRRMKIAIWWLALGTIPVALVSSLVGMGAAGVFIGLSISPALIAANTVVEHLAPKGSVTEAFAWLSSALASGAALGSLVTGVVLDELGTRTGQTLGLIGALGAAVGVMVWAQHLKPPADDHTDSDPAGDGGEMAPRLVTSADPA